MKYRFDFSNLDTLRVTNQDGVKQFVYPSPSKFNASWDSILHPNGKVYFALCTELTTSSYTKLVEYDFKNNTVRDIFDSESMILPNERFIRDSKLHTSLSLMEDGSLIMATHTTDKAPEHPAWMPFSNYANPWEGFAGSSVLTYNPKTDHTENHGILVPRESLYGAIYDKKNRVYYALGYIKGHLYRYHLDTRRVEDLGKQVERASYRLIIGPDENIYFSTRNGLMKRINTESQEVEILNWSLPDATHQGYNYAYLTCGTSKDESIYVAGMHSDQLSEFNTSTDIFKKVGTYTDFDKMIQEYETTKYIGGMAFDKQGILWYVVCGARLDNNEDFITASTLMKWDLKNPPVNMGIVGTEERASVRTCGIHYHTESDTLIIVGTNHANDGVEITTLNLSLTTEDKGPICKDPLIYPKNGEYDVYGQSIVDHWDIVSDNTYKNQYLRQPLALWKQLDKGEKIVNMESNLIETNIRTYVLNNDTLSKSDTNINNDTQNDLSKLNDLPYYNGRQYRAVVDKSVAFQDGTYLVSTLDGMFAIVDGDSCFSLGSLGVFSTVKKMIKVDENTVIGIMGDRDDISQIFRYKKDKGLKTLGMAAYEDSSYGCHHSTCLGSITYDTKKELIVFSSDDEMPTLYYMEKGDIQ